MNEEVIQRGLSRRALPRLVQPGLAYLARRLRFGTLVVETPRGDTLRFVGGDSPDPVVHWRLRNYKPLWALLSRGAVGFGESYMAGDWDTDSLATMLLLAARNEAHLEAWSDESFASRLLSVVKHRLRANSRKQARRNIAYHYDLGNSFYERWLDPSMSYSAALFAHPQESLEAAQTRKYARLADLLELGGTEEVLEVGCGWGGFMEYAAGHHGARVHGISISNEQCRYAGQRLRDAGLGHLTKVENVDYRDVEGRYDRIASIEMFEAVGEAYWDTYAAKLKSLLRPNGLAALQVITIDEERFDDYRRSPDFIQKYVFPGGMLPSRTALEATFARAGLAVTDTFCFGLDYARTLKRWRERFNEQWPQLEALGFDERFRRMWLFYLTYCEAGFRVGAVDVVQVRLADLRVSGGALPRSIVAAYGLPGFIVALPVIPVAVLLPNWYAQDLGLGFVITGIALAFARLLDFASDIIVGVLADRFNWRGYRYKPLIMAGALVAGSGLLMLAAPPADVGTAWLIAGSLVLFSGWTILVIPYTAWGAELSEDRYERSRLTASREIAGLCGMLLALAAPLVAARIDGGGTVAPLMAVAVAAIALGVPALVLCARYVPEPHLDLTPSASRVRFSDVPALWRVPAFPRTLACWLINGVANGLPAVLFPIVVGDYFALDDTALYALLIVYFGAAILAMPLWLRISRHHGKVDAWRIAIGVNVLVFSSVLLLGPDQAPWFAAICLASGASLGADLSLPPSLQADILGNDRLASGTRRSATAFACWSMATKLSLALAVAIAFLGLGLVDADDGQSAAQSAPHVLLGLYVALPIALKGVVLVLLRTLEGDVSRSAQTAANVT